MQLKRKQIEIKPETFKALSIQAAEKGTNLKRYIESILDEKAEEAEDLYLYNKYVKNNPECWEMLDPTEQEAFEKELGL